MPIPDAPISRRFASCAPSAARRSRYSSAGACGSRSRTGGHQRRTASPIGVSKWLVPAGGASKPSLMWLSKASRSATSRATPWQWSSTRGRSSSTCVAGTPCPLLSVPPAVGRGDGLGVLALERLHLRAANRQEGPVEGAPHGLPEDVRLLQVRDGLAQRLGQPAYATLLQLLRRMAGGVVRELGRQLHPLLQPGQAGRDDRADRQV